MKINALVIADEKRTAQTKTGPRTFRQLTLLDNATPKLKNTFDFTMSPEDMGRVEGQAFIGKSLDLDVTDIRPGYGGRIEMHGTFIAGKAA